MQTFLPYPDFADSARALDNRRLGKQRVETLQILNVLQNPEAKGWRNHPAVKMWRGHEEALIRYGVTICDEWLRRGFKDTVREKLLAKGSPEGPVPQWIGDERLHSSHRASLLRKDPDHYQSFGWMDDVPETFWPV